MASDSANIKAGASLRRRDLLAGAAALASGALVFPARAQGNYPDRPVKLIVASPAGGPNDLVGRLLANGLKDALDQTVVVENRGGSGSVIGINAVARAEPDGYTLLLCSNGMTTSPSLFKNVSFDPFKDFEPLAELGTAPNVFLAHPDSPYRTIADLVAAAKAAPGRIDYASPGIGTTPHLGAELFKIRAGIDLLHIPYVGVPATLRAVLAGDQKVSAFALSIVSGHIKEGRLRALAVTGPTRWPDLPDVPTMIEEGYPGFISDSFIATFAPAGTPRPITERLTRDIIAAIQLPEARAKSERVGFTIRPRGSEALRRRIEEETPLWRDVIAKAGLKPE